MFQLHKFREKTQRGWEIWDLGPNYLSPYDLPVKPTKTSFNFFMVPTYVGPSIASTGYMRGPRKTQIHIHIFTNMI